MYADAPSDQIDMLISKKVDGIVIAGVGNGNFNKAYTEAVKRAVAQALSCAVQAALLQAGWCFMMRSMMRNWARSFLMILPRKKQGYY
jgi:L-asparaginase/Glu-tRNA(Gln) amidotransferase subunit D